MPRKYVSEYVKKRLCGARVLGSITEANASTPIIGTHNGSFHCDEALACAMLRCSKKFGPANIIRTRDPDVLEQCHIVVDVGGVYDEDKMRFDHHQPSFHGTMETPKRMYNTRLSSAGLVYKHFGREIIQDYVESALSSSYSAQLLDMGNWSTSRKGLSERELDTVFDIVYMNFVEHIDGIDNGVNAYGPAGEAALADAMSLSCVRNYIVSTTLSDRIGRLLPWWNEDGNGKVECENAAFLQAVELVASEFISTVHYHVFAWLPARGIVEDAFLTATDVHPSGQIIVFRDRFCPWKDHLFELEEASNKTGHVLYALFADKGNWRVQAVPQEIAGFQSRKPLPWRGLRDEELSKASGIDGGIFVHVSGFIGGNKTYEGALQMAVKALTATS